jgi:protein TonB
MPAPDPADAALLEYMPDSPVSSAENATRSGAESDPSKQYPWQPRKPLAEPMASALRRAAEAAGKSEFDGAAPRAAGASPTSAPQVSAPPVGMSQSGFAQAGFAQAGFAQAKTGAAAAPARAKEIPVPDAKKLGLEPTASAIAVPAKEEETEIKRIEDPSASDGWESNSISVAAEAHSAALLDGDPQASDAGGSKKTVMIAVLLIGLAAAGYFGWTKMQSAHSQPVAPQSAVPASPETSALPPQPTASASETQPATGELVVTPQTEQGSIGTTVGPSASKPSAAVLAEGPGAKTSVPAKATPAADEITVVKAPATDQTEAAPVLMVHNGSSTQAKPEPEVQESEQAPAATSIATGTSTNALSGIVNTTAINAQKAPEQTLRISQGVSQGLIIKKVQPAYPPQARQMRLEGKVELQANISRSGSISSIKQLSGDLVLGRAAMDAVRQWKYKPYYLNGEPVEVQTQVTVNFKLP